MNCSNALEAMLLAEPGELRRDATSELAEHLRGCLSCRRAAAAILADTRVLARVAHRAAGRRRVTRGAAIAGLAAAGIVLVLVARATSSRSPRPADDRSLSGAAPAIAASQAVNPPRADTPTTAESRTARAEPRHEHALARRIQAVAIQPAAIVATPIPLADSMAADGAAPVLSVRPHGGRRAAVFRVAASNVTVVWLY